MTDGEFFLNHRTLHDFIAVATEIVRDQSEVASKLGRLRALFETLLNDSGWLPSEFKEPSTSTTMGHGIASLLLYRSSRKDLSLSTLVVAPGLATPVHNHLSWGMVGLCEGEQEEEEFDTRDHDAEAVPGPLKLRVRRILRKAGFLLFVTERMRSQLLINNFRLYLQSPWRLIRSGHLRAGQVVGVRDRVPQFCRNR